MLYKFQLLWRTDKTRGDWTKWGQKNKNVTLLFPPPTFVQFTFVRDPSPRFMCMWRLYRTTFPPHQRMELNTNLHRPLDKVRILDPQPISLHQGEMIDEMWTVTLIAFDTDVTWAQIIYDGTPLCYTNNNIQWNTALLHKHEDHLPRYHNKWTE